MQEGLLGKLICILYSDLNRQSVIRYARVGPLNLKMFVMHQNAREQSPKTNSRRRARASQTEEEEGAGPWPLIAN